MLESEGATTPLAFPPTVNAPTRNSGCAHVITVLERGPADTTIPISPSGATTGSNSDTRSLRPTSSSRVRPSVATDWRRTSAAT